MDAQHIVEVFTAGCPSCNGAVAYGHELAASSDGYRVRIWNVKHAEAHARMHRLGITEPPAIAIDGEPLICCGGPTDRRSGA